MSHTSSAESAATNAIGKTRLAVIEKAVSHALDTRRRLHERG
jgi:hypothetical protein